MLFFYMTFASNIRENLGGFFCQIFSFLEFSGVKGGFIPLNNKHSVVEFIVPLQESHDASAMDTKPSV